MNTKNIHSHGIIVIITGERGSGKSTLCRLVVRAASEYGIAAAGILSPPGLMNGVHAKIFIEDVVTGERRLLAHRRTAPDPVSPTPEWNFISGSLTWGNALLESAVPTDLLVVDELGPLEFTEGCGWQAGLNVLDSRTFRLALVVVRPELLPVAQHRWPDARTVTVTSPHAAAALAAQILQEYFGSD